jgi:predicted RNA binding protein YcfA (HicA-like mRNA interferase family)
VVIVALAAAARAEDPPRTSQEVIVYGQLLVQQARDEVVKELQHEGYTKEIDRGDHTIYRNDDPWKGEVVLYDDGWMEVKRQPFQLQGRQMPWAKENSALAWAGCVLYPWLCIRPGGILVGERKWRARESRTVDGVHDEVRNWSERVADLHTGERVDTLGDALTALWEQGTPLEGDGPLLETADERKQALLAYWSSRTDTEWGDRVRLAIEAFTRAVVQHSDTPFTPEEISAFNATTSARRPFSLEPPPL